MASRKTSTAQAELTLLPSLKNCLLNLPSSLVAVLLNSNTVAQNVVVELSYRQPAPAGQQQQDAKQKAAASVSKSVFLGWTGMQSQSKLAPVVGKDGIAGSRDGGRQEREVPTVEVDATFGRLLGLGDGMKVGVALHLDPPQAHTVNIEPVTATDWEIIELHARFLEMNFLSQVRALPNPATGSPHPLTLHLTPTATANILVTSLTPTAASTQPFVKISPDAEVIVAPKTRQPSRPTSARDTRSVTSTSRRSAGGKSASGRHRGEDEKARPPLFLRGVTRALQSEWFEDGGEEMKDEGLKIWLDREHLLSKTLRGVTWVAVTVIKPAGLQEQSDPQAQPTLDQIPAGKVVAKLYPWEDAPDAHHVALSSVLCSILGAEGLVGGIVRIDPAPSPLPKTASALKEPSQQASKYAIVKRLRTTPFAGVQTKKTAGFKFGGETKAEKEEAATRIKSIFGKALWEGPLTDGMLLPKQDSWPGGLLDFEPAPPGDPSKARLNWLLGSERKLDISMQPETAPPKLPAPPGEPLPAQAPSMVGIESLTTQTRSSLLHSSSVLLTGGLGSGKSSLAQLLAHQLRDEYLFHTIYFPCRNLVTDETRVKTIKDTLNRIFASASWGARLGGRALVILDDLDRLCPVETELQVDANGRSRQVSELLCSIVRQFCGRDSGAVLLATAQSKEAVHSVIIGGHVVRDIIALKAPDKDGRRKVLDMLMRKARTVGTDNESAPAAVNGTARSEWMEGSDDSRPATANGENWTGIDPNLDLLDIAGQTDGYMPGDLALLVSRARSEALIRAVSDHSLSDDITLTADDFEAALKGFTPASLRGVPLHSSTTTFASIGGLRQTRQILLETLQYPTTYAPLFAKCPLRLRSGLLLYGYPGCGKTLLASAVAGECGLNFISVKGPEILNKYIGASEKSVRDLFERAEAAKPCVLFFDEFDSIAPKRGHDSTGVTDRVVNMLLTMMDGAEGLSGVYVLAATSRPDMIDPALLRPGRLDKSLICDMPDEEDRLDILRAICGKLKVDADVVEGTHPRSLVAVAKQTEGYSGADLQAVLYNAHLEAIHDLLGPNDTGAQDFGKRKTSGSGRSSKPQDFSYFRLGGDDNAASTPQSAAAVAAERAQIAAKISAMHLARRKAKQERHAANQQQRPGSAAGVGGQQHQTNGVSEESNKEPVILWKHMQKSLASSRSSISVQDRRRLGKIYNEFVVGRNGEMSDGQGSSEIGGRTSLM
ncbi:Peroxisome biosynthesis protein pex1 [Vermiconidia calcicola]|uniref:Peroxisome biosynthesis protein pex1 n=1 Tax=Vermiconidia calcicola TaxID=1690605 RepID=A0ACC3NLK1_9PEZI|nr:Peroxisome biosynthesis protein pex1 [Vermiconidia calcicola]